MASAREGEAETGRKKFQESLLRSLKDADDDQYLGMPGLPQRKQQAYKVEVFH